MPNPLRVIARHLPKRDTVDHFEWFTQLRETKPATVSARGPRTAPPVHPVPDELPAPRGKARHVGDWHPGYDMAVADIEAWRLSLQAECS